MRRELIVPNLTLAVLNGLLGGAALAQSGPDTVGARWDFDSQTGRYRVEVVAAGVRVPFGMAALPNGRLLISDRPGTLWSFDPRTGTMTRIAGVPAVFDSVDAGLLDIEAHPDFAHNAWVYFAYTEKTDSGKATVVERARLRDSTLTDRQKLFTAFPAARTNNHFGSGLAFRDGYLYVTLGDREIGDLAQEPWTHLGKVIRLHDDGRVPADNPFVGRPGTRPEIWTLGHRNPHGLAVHPESGELWEAEHGPLGGDEINVIDRGANYGWPVVTFGREYDGGSVGAGLTHAPGMTLPVHHYSTSAALSGIAFYTGSAFPRWRNNLFVGAMTPRFLARLIVTNGRVVGEERLLLEKRWRVRSVQTGSDGFLYVGVQRTADGAGGVIARLRPVTIQ